MSSSSSEMTHNWNLRAQKDALHYIETKHGNQDETSFFALGEERAQLLIDPVLKSLRIDGAGKTAVDIGCGVGRFTQALGRRFASAIGIDVSDVMVARARNAATGLPNLTFVHGDGIKLPQPDDTADFVWCYEVLQHMPSHEIIQSNLGEVARVLRPGGYSLLHFKTTDRTPVLNAERVLPAVLIQRAKQLLGHDPLTADQSWRGAKPITKATIGQMCSKAGLSVVAFRDDPTHAAGTRAFAVVMPA